MLHVSAAIDTHTHVVLQLVEHLIQGVDAQSTYSLNRPARDIQAQRMDVVVS